MEIESRTRLLLLHLKFLNKNYSFANHQQDTLDSVKYQHSVVTQLIPVGRELTVAFLNIDVMHKIEKRAQQLQQTIDDIKLARERVIQCAEHFHSFRSSADGVEQWLAQAAHQLDSLFLRADSELLGQNECLQYWVSLSCLHRA